MSTGPVLPSGASIAEDGDGALRAVLDNGIVRAVFTPQQGMDLLKLVHVASGIDVLMKTPWPHRRPSDLHPPHESPIDSWIERYHGGWQLLAPNAGDAASLLGGVVPMHGEAAMRPWECRATTTATAAVLGACVGLTRAPLHLERTVRLEAGSAVLSITDRIVNESPVAVELIVGHHPAFGAPLVGEHTVIDTPAQWVEVDAEYIPANRRVDPGRHDWPVVPGPQGMVDLTRMPPRGEARDLVAYLGGHSEGWYAITNPELGIGAGLRWDTADFPYVWMWQELGSTAAYPWFGRGHVTALEPCTSYPNTGLHGVRRTTRTQRVLAPHASQDFEVRAVLYESRGGVRRIDERGAVELR